MDEIERFKRTVRAMAKKKKKTRPPALSTGSTLLNLACTGTPYGGFYQGHYYFIVGDSSSGKTFLSLTCFAEAAKNKNFKDHRLIFDNPEDGALMDLEKFFGRKMFSRLEAPGGPGVYSRTIEDFYYHVDDAIQTGEPFLYVLDSMDSLTSMYSEKKFKEGKVAHRRGTKGKGSYGDGKAQINSEGIRKLLKYLPKTGSILIIINQTRDNIGAGLFEPKKTRSGGHALTFYATLEIWSSVREQLKKEVRGKKRQMGIVAACRVKKNRITGRDRTVEIPIYHSFGFDDTGGCIRFLVKEGHWKTSKGKINAVEFNMQSKLSILIRHIEDNNQEQILKNVVADVWMDIEEALKVERKPRYE